MICILFSITNVKSEDKSSVSYDAVYKDGDGEYSGLDGPVLVENVIWKKFDKILTEKFKRKDKQKLLSSLHQYKLSDTIVSVKIYDIVRGSVNEYLNIGTKIIVYSYYHRGGDATNLKIFDFKDMYHPSSQSFETTDMIMLNVFARWDMDEITCLLESSTPVCGASYTVIAERYILLDKRIKSFMRISFTDCLGWKLHKCYGNNYPKYLLLDRRYNDSDSTISRYMTGYIYDKLYWNNKRK